MRRQAESSRCASYALGVARQPSFGASTRKKSKKNRKRSMKDKMSYKRLRAQKRAASKTRSRHRLLPSFTASGLGFLPGVWVFGSWPAVVSRVKVGHHQPCTLETLDYCPSGCNQTRGWSQEPAIAFPLPFGDGSCAWLGPFSFS